MSDEESAGTQSKRLSLTVGDTSTDSGAEAGGDQKVLTLAEQFLAAMPARIKNPNDHNDHGHHVHDPMQWEDCSCDASQSDDLGIESMGDDYDMDLNIEECQAYRYVISCTIAL